MIFYLMQIAGKTHVVQLSDDGAQLVRNPSSEVLEAFKAYLLREITWVRRPWLTVEQESEVLRRQLDWVVAESLVGKSIEELATLVAGRS